MRGRKHFFTKCFIAVLVVFLTGMLSAAVVSAEEPYIPKKRVAYLDDSLESVNIYLPGVKLSDVTKLKSSKKSVAAVSKRESGDDVIVSVELKKAGTTTVSFNYKYEGKTRKAKTKIIVRKHVNPCKTFKVGSKNYASKFNKTAHIAVTKTLKGKLKIKLKAGYVIKEISVYSWNGEEEYRSVKNNKTVKVTSGKTLSLQISPKDAPDEDPIFLEIRVV